MKKVENERALWTQHLKLPWEQATVKVVIFARVIFRASAIFDIFACF